MSEWNNIEIFGDTTFSKTVGQIKLVRVEAINYSGLFF